MLIHDVELHVINTLLCVGYEYYLVDTRIIIFLMRVMQNVSDTDRAPCSLRWVVHESMLFYSPHSFLSL